MEGHVRSPRPRKEALCHIAHRTALFKLSSGYAAQCALYAQFYCGMASKAKHLLDPRSPIAKRQSVITNARTDDRILISWKKSIDVTAFSAKTIRPWLIVEPSTNTIPQIGIHPKGPSTDTKIPTRSEIELGSWIRVSWSLDSRCPLTFGVSNVTTISEWV